MVHLLADGRTLVFLQKQVKVNIILKIINNIIFKFMGLASNLETNAIGGGGFGGGYGFAPSFGFGGFGGGGGIGGLGLVGLLGLNSFLGRDGFDHGRGRGGCDNDDNCAREAAILAAISNSKDATVAEGRALGAAICATDASIKDAQFALALQAERNTAQLSSQAQAFQISTEKSIDALMAAGAAQTATILARINQTEVDNLRDQLANERRGRDLDVIRIENNNTNTNIQGQFQAQAQAQLQRDLDEHRRRWDNREIEINNINTNTNVQAQLQAQAQWNRERDFENLRRWDTLFAQNNKVGQDIVNIGGTIAANQTSSPTNVNSKQS